MQVADSAIVVVPSVQTCLTSREESVARLLVLGLSNKEIAAKLKLGKGTVKAHVSSILFKLGVQTRYRAAVVLYQMGYRSDHAQGRES